MSCRIAHRKPNGLGRAYDVLRLERVRQRLARFAPVTVDMVSVIVIVIVTAPSNGC